MKSLRDNITVYLSFLFSNYPMSTFSLSPLYEDLIIDRDCPHDTYPFELPLSDNTTPADNALSYSRVPIFYTNARSLCNKMSLLRLYLSDSKPLIACVTETWGKCDIDDAFFSIQNYVMYRCDRSNNVGGGVIIYVSTSLTSTFISEFSLSGAEAITCRVTFSPSRDPCDLVISCVYRPPSYSLIMSPLLEYMYNIPSTFGHFHIICGDFNSPDISWYKFSPSISQSPLVEWAMDNFLSQHVSVPTRPDSQTVLDLIFSTTSTVIESIKAYEPLGSSDHVILSYDVLVPCIDSSPSPKKIRVFSKAKWKVFRDYLSNCTWPTTPSDINDLWLAFLRNITSAAEAAIPLVPKRAWCPLNSPKIRSALKTYRSSYDDYKARPTTLHKLRQRFYLSRLNSLIYSETCRHESRLADTINKNPKYFWSYVKLKTKVSSRISTIQNPDGVLTSDPHEVAESFSSFFSGVFRTSDCLSSNSCDLRNPHDFCLDDIHFSPDIVYYHLKRLPSSSSHDPDGLCYEYLKRGGFFLASKLSDLFRFSLANACIPDTWRNVNVIPVHKSGPRDSCCNYRPIAITNCVSRLMEKIICQQVLKYLRCHDLLMPSQHGFLPGRSVETAGVAQLNFLTAALDKGLSVDTLYLDYSKAFDSIPHYLLVQKLHLFGLSDPLLSWISDYLCERYQSVYVNGVFSSPKVISSGVIQGSVLGPLLFLIYVNDVDNYLSPSFVIKYADDIKLSTSFLKSDSQSTAQVQLQQALSELYLWSVKNGLSLNPQKCKVIHFGFNNPCFSYTVGQSTVANVTSFKDLGVYISQKCNFNEHVHVICLKANRFLGLVQKVFVSRSKSLLLAIYKSRIRPLLEFGCILWCPYRLYLSEQIERVQHRFSRLFPDLRLLPYRERLKDLNLYSLRTRRLRYKLIFLYKMLNNLIDLDPTDFFVFSTSSSLRGNSLRLIPPSSSKDCRRHFFTVDTVFHWNNMLDVEVKVPNVVSFKRSVASYFLRNDIW